MTLTTGELSLCAIDDKMIHISNLLFCDVRKFNKYWKDINGYLIQGHSIREMYWNPGLVPDSKKVLFLLIIKDTF